MPRFFVVGFLMITVQSFAQVGTREDELPEIVNVVIQHHKIDTVLARILNEDLISLTNGLKDFRPLNIDTVVEFNIAQQKDFRDQLATSPKKWKPEILNAYVEAEDLQAAIDAAVVNDWMLPEKHKHFTHWRVSSYGIALPVLSIDRQTAYVAVTMFMTVFKGKRLEINEGSGGIYVLRKVDGHWVVLTYFEIITS
jgi:hypothetical protein